MRINQPILTLTPPPPPPPQVSLCVLLLRYQPEGDIHGFVNFLSEEQNSKRKEGVLAECEKDACSPTSEGGGDEYGGPPTNTCGAKNLPSLGDNEMLIGKPDKNAYTAGHPNYGTVDMGTGIEAEESEGGVSRRLKKLIGPRYYTLRIQLGLPGKMDRPTVATGKTVTVCVLLLFISQFAFCSFIIFGESRARLLGLLKGQPAKRKPQKHPFPLTPGSSYIAAGHWWALLLLVFFIIFIALLVIIILQQPENPKRLPYMAPCVPFVPASAMLVNVYLMLKLSAITWIRFSIWCFIGELIRLLVVVYLFIYFLAETGREEGFDVWISDNSEIDFTAAVVKVTARQKIPDRLRVVSLPPPTLGGKSRLTGASCSGSNLAAHLPAAACCSRLERHDSEPAESSAQLGRRTDSVLTEW